MIHFDCLQCHERMSVPESMKGHREKCPHCDGLQRVPDHIEAVVGRGIPSPRTDVRPPTPKRKTTGTAAVIVFFLAGVGMLILPPLGMMLFCFGMGCLVEVIVNVSR